MDATDGTKDVKSERAEMYSAILTATLPFALSLGLDLEAIATTLEIAPQDLFSVERRLPDDTLPRLWLMMAAQRPDEPLPIAMAQTVPLSYGGGLAGAAQFADDLGTALDLIAENVIVLADRVEFRVRVEGDCAAIVKSHPLDHLDQGAGTQASMAFCWRLIKDVLKGETQLLQVDLVHDGKGGKAAYEAFFRGPVVERTQRNALIFPASDLRKPVEHACAQLFAYAREHFRQWAARRANSGPPSDFSRLREAVLRNASQGRFDPTSVASSVGFSLRSAQRLASVQGTTVLEMIDAVRADMAKDLLMQHGATNESVGAVVGYSDGRAFRRWTGQSPSQFRQERRHQG